jgi:hypothetical protein
MKPNKNSKRDLSKAASCYKSFITWMEFLNW